MLFDIKLPAYFLGTTFTFPIVFPIVAITKSKKIGKLNIVKLKKKHLKKEKILTKSKVSSNEKRQLAS